MSKHFSIRTNKFRKFYLITIYHSYFFLPCKFLNLDLRKNKFFQCAKIIRTRIFELFNCAKIKGTKIRGARNLMGLRYLEKNEYVRQI